MPDQSTFLRNPVSMYSSNTHGGITKLPSSFGPANTTSGPEDLEPSTKPSDGPEIDPRALFYSERSKELEYRERFYTGQQHNDRPFDSAGRYRGTNVEAWSTQPLMSSNAPEHYAPLDSRRPGSPKRIGRSMVRRFTSMLFGSHRFPQIRSHDAKTQDFAQELAKVACVQKRFNDLRNIGGACGTGAVSWCFYDGKPIVRTHLGRYVHVLEWTDFDAKDAAHAIELYIVPIVVRDEEGVLRPVDHWVRRDWTLDEDVVYKPHPILKDGERYTWERDEAACFHHGDGFCHFEWCVNESDFEPDSVDGQPDYAEQYEAMDQLDITYSVLIRGTQKNLDPTLVVKGSRSGLDILMKGSDNAIFLDPDTNPNGSATYLELSGASTTAGLALFNSQRQQILEDAQCVIADPNEIAAAGTSGAAIELLYMPMVSVCDDRRGVYGPVLMRLLDRMVQSARKLLAPQEYAVDVDGGADPSPIPAANDDDGDPAIVGGGEPDANPGLRVVPDLPDEPPPAVEYFLKLEPRVIEELAPDGRTLQRTEERVPGEGSVFLAWGQYFPPTVADKSAATAGLGAANGAKPTLSQRTSVETMSALYDLDPTEEWRRVQDEADAARQRELGITPGIGGDDIPQVPPGTPPAPDPSVPPVDATGGPGGAPGADHTHILDPSSSADVQDGVITDTDMAVVVTVNEARASRGYGILRKPDGTPDPDGNLTVAEFKAKREAKGEAEGDIQGGGAVPAAAKPPPAPIPPVGAPKLPGF